MKLIHLLVIVSLGLIAYSNSFQAPFVFDDVDNIVENPYIKDFSYFLEPSRTGPIKGSDLFTSRYLGYLSFAINYSLSGLDVMPYHAVNFSIHAICAILLYMLVEITFQTPGLSGSAYSGNARWIAFYASLLFMVHPVQTQAVTYIVQRFTSLAAMFYLLALVLYVMARMRGYSMRGIAYYIAAFMAGIYAMKTKEIAFTLPLAMALYDVMFLGGTVRQRLTAIVPMLVLMAIIPYDIYQTQDASGGILDELRVSSELSRWDYLMTQFTVVVTYIRLLVFPLGQHLDYDYPLFHSFFRAEVFISFLFILMSIGFGAYMAKAARRSEPAQGLIAFGVFWFFLTLSVESSLIPISDLIFEHRAYLPSAGFFIGVSIALQMVFDSMAHKRVMKRAIAVSALLVPVLLIAASHVRNDVWSSEISLWSDVVMKSPNNARAHHNLGVAYAKQGYNDLAINHYALAAEGSDDFANPRINLGNEFYHQGNLDLALKNYGDALRIEPMHFGVHNNMGNIYAVKKDIQNAVAHYKTAIGIKPDYAEAYCNLGQEYRKLGLRDLAKECYLSAIKHKSDYANAYYNLGLIQIEEGAMSLARKSLSIALSLDPGHREARTLMTSEIVVD